MCELRILHFFLLSVQFVSFTNVAQRFHPVVSIDAHIGFSWRLLCHIFMYGLQAVRVHNAAYANCCCYYMSQIRPRRQGKVYCG